MSKITSVLLTAALIAQVALPAAAQTNSTPTPAPSKTPTAAPLAATPTFASSEAAQFTPLTQADLSVLTANVQRPNGITWFENKLYTACTGDDTVYVINDTTGDTRAYIGGVHNLQTLYVETDAQNNPVVWAPDYTDNTLIEVTHTRVQTIARNLKGPWGISYVDDQHFLVSNLLSNSINLLSRSGDDQVVLDGLASPMGITHDDQTLYVANYGSTHRSIEWYSYTALVNGQPSNTTMNHVLVSGLQNVTDVQLGSDGKLYFAYALGNRGLVGRVDPQVCEAIGGCTNDQVEIVLYSDLDVPLAGLTLTPDMRMFVHSMFKPEIYWAQISG